MSGALGLALDAALAGTPFHGRVESHEVLGSTIDRCREAAEAGAPAGLVVIARRQEAGRGQPGHSWSSPEGGLHLSALLRPALLASDAAILAPLTGLAACEALRGLGVPCRLKLPNDLVAVREGRWRKLGGMLVDTAMQGPTLRHAIVSLGVNVEVPSQRLPEHLREVAVSCHELVARAPSIEAVAATFLREIADGLESCATRQGRAALRESHAEHVRDVHPGDPFVTGQE